LVRYHYEQGKQGAKVEVLKDKILASSVKNAVADLTVSGGLSFLTANPVYATTQAIRSGTSVLSAYMDPFRESRITEYANMSAVPGFELLKGANPVTVLVPLVTNIFIHELAKQEDIKLPELAKQFTSSSISGLILKDKDKIVSGMVGALIGEGMDKARQLMQGELSDDPSWNERLGQAFFNSEEVRGFVTQRLMIALEGDKTEKLEGSQEPVINEEVARQLEINRQELARAEALLVQKDAGVNKAQEKVDEKFREAQKLNNSKHSSIKDEDKAQKKLNAAHGNLNNFTKERDGQKAVVDVLKVKDAELRSRLYSPVEEKDCLNRASCEKDYNARVQTAYDTLIQKDAGVSNAAKYLEDKTKEYNENCHKDKYYSKLKQAIKNYNNALTERDNAVNKLYALQCIDTRVNTPHEKIPERASTWEKTKMWVDENVEINIGINFSVPLYPVPKQVSSTYSENQIEKALEGLPTDKLTFKDPNPQTTQEKPKDISDLLPKSNAPMQIERPITGGWDWQSYQNYRDALMMQTVENAIVERQLQCFYDAFGWRFTSEDDCYRH